MKHESDYERQMKIARRIMKEKSKLLKRLAKS